MRRWVAAVLCGLVLSSAAPAFADAAVHVIVRNSSQKPVDGIVSLAPSSGGGRYSCSTRGGACTIASVPGGQYIVTFKPSAGSAPAPHKVMIPPDGKVDLHISAK